MASRRSVISILVLIIVICATAAFPRPARAQAKIAIFFSGWCARLTEAPRPNQPDYRRDNTRACAAASSAGTVLRTAGATIVSPVLNEGNYCSGQNRNTPPQQCTPISQTLSDIRGKDVTLIAFSAGSNAMKHLVDEIKRRNPQDLNRIKILVSLEATSGPFNAAVATVQSMNSSVAVRYYRASQFGTDHDGIPGSGRMANEMLRLMGESPATLIADAPPPPRLFTNSAGSDRNRYGPNLLSSLFGQGQPYTGAYGAAAPGSSPFSSLFSAFSPPPPQSPPFIPQPLPSALSVLNSNPSAVQATQAAHVTNSVSVGNANTLSNQNNSSATAQQATSTVASQQGAISTFETRDRVEVSYRTPEKTTDVRAALTEIYARVRDILQTLLNFLRGQR